MNVAYYVYNKEDQVGLNFKAISNHPIITKNTVFLSFSDPPMDMF